MRWSNCQAIFSGLARSLITTGMSRSRSTRATGPAELFVRRERRPVGQVAQAPGELDAAPDAVGADQDAGGGLGTVGAMRGHGSAGVGDVDQALAVLDADAAPGRPRRGRKCRTPVV